MTYSANPYTQLARAAVASWLRGQACPEQPAALPPDVHSRRAGAFVSLNKGDTLRGCMGTITPTRRTLAEEITHNAVQAATRDPRFPPVTEDELDDIVFSVDVLSPPEPCTQRGLEPGVYGVIVEHGRKKGLLLPALPGVDTAEQQIRIALQKADIDPQEPYTLHRFTVQRYTER